MSQSTPSLSLTLTFVLAVLGLNAVVVRVTADELSLPGTTLRPCPLSVLLFVVDVQTTSAFCRRIPVRVRH